MDHFHLHISFHKT